MSITSLRLGPKVITVTVIRVIHPKSVKRFERSNGPDIALYKNYLFYIHVIMLPQDGEPAYRSLCWKKTK